MKCDECDAAMINGVFCHETGCPNTRKRYDSSSDTWKTICICRECGGEYDPDNGPCCEE